MRDALKPNQRQSGVISAPLRCEERGEAHLITRFLRHLSESGGCMRLVKRPPDEGGHQRSSEAIREAIRGHQRPSEVGHQREGVEGAIEPIEVYF